MLTIAFQSMIYLFAALACITLTHVESSGIRTLESEYDIAPAERKIENMMDYFVRTSRGYGKLGHIFDRIARTEVLQTSPLIRFGKRNVMDDGRSEVITRLLQYLQQQQPYFDESNRSHR